MTTIDITPFEEEIRRREHLDRIELIKALVEAERIVQSTIDWGMNKKRYSAPWRKADEAGAQIPTFGRVIYFLRFRSLASGTTDAEQALCKKLARRFLERGQWEGEYSL